MLRSCYAVVLSAFLILLPGCGTSGCFFISTMAVAPALGTANHSELPPGNQVIFVLQLGDGNNFCPVPTPVQAAWTVSDPDDVQISSAKDSTNGAATCLHATAAPITITASYQGKIARAQLMCK